jgi:hypothetical protein
MQASTFAFAVAFVVVTACAQTSQPTAVTAPVASPTAGDSGSAGAGTAPASGSAASVSAGAPIASAAANDAGANTGGPTDMGAAAPGGAADAGAAAQFRACTLDSDCVAVDRVGCCHNGWKEAVAAGQKDAYAKSFTCPEANPMCPMYLVRDPRVPLCDNAAHLCTMTRPEDVACGGFIRNKHVCPSGYHCQLSKHPDIPGKCVQP